MVLQEEVPTQAQATVHLRGIRTPEATLDPATTHGQGTHHHHTEATAIPSRATHMSRSQLHSNRSHMK